MRQPHPHLLPARQSKYEDCDQPSPRSTIISTTASSSASSSTVKGGSESSGSSSGLRVQNPVHLLTSNTPPNAGLKEETASDVTQGSKPAKSTPSMLKVKPPSVTKKSSTLTTPATKKATVETAKAKALPKVYVQTQCDALLNREGPRLVTMDMVAGPSHVDLPLYHHDTLDIERWY